MIVPMAHLRILGPKESLDRVLEALQRLGLVQLCPAPLPGDLAPTQEERRKSRVRRNVERILEDVEAVLSQSPPTAPPADAPVGPLDRAACLKWARLASRARRWLRNAQDTRERLEKERANLHAYLSLEEIFRSVLGSRHWDSLRTYEIVLKPGEEAAAEQLSRGLQGVLGTKFEIFSTPLKEAGTALLLAVPSTQASRVEQLLAQARIEELRVPPEYGSTTLEEAAPRMRQRLKEIELALERLETERAARFKEWREELGPARYAVHDLLLRIEAQDKAALTPHAFVLEGWAPKASVARIERRLSAEFGPSVVLELVSLEEWEGENAPVVLRNPRIFRPFELLTSLFPLPRYGTIDPTPYVAVFFPMFFGIVLGDLGYGLLLAISALILRGRGAPESKLRAVGEIAGACAAFSVVFGFLYGEFFGDVGRRWFGLKPLLFDRRDALIPFLALALALGFVHVLLGLVLGVASRIRWAPRAALRQGLEGTMLIIIAGLLLGAVGLLPKSFFSPLAIALLVAFPLLIVIEGFLAPLEFLTTIANILSYARIMALGTGSILLAVVANRLAGAVGSLAVGALFGLLFHLVNFLLGLLGPTVHALRLQYVEFFGKFYSPGGLPFEPLARWKPALRANYQP